LKDPDASLPESPPNWPDHIDAPAFNGWNFHMPMNKISILTDIRIDQCPRWREETTYLLPSQTDRNSVISLLSQVFFLLLKCKKYDVVITENIRLAQIFGYLRALLKWKKPQHIVSELMLDEPQESCVWRIKSLFQTKCFSCVDAVFVSARREIQTYSKRLGIPQSRIRYLPFHTNIVHPEMLRKTSGYIFSAGRTGRDYAVLADAVECLETRVVVVCDRKHAAGVSFPPNVELYVDIPYAKYLDLLRGCSMVVVPLKRRIKSTGQVVLLAAMSLGKPVVATDTVGTEDYIEPGVSGTLVPVGDSAALRKVILEFLDDPSPFVEMASKAFEKILEEHTFEKYTGNILDAAHELVHRT
jgi:glycosyltransferase involved in cell wall biosynthesis